MWSFSNQTLVPSWRLLAAAANSSAKSRGEKFPACSKLLPPVFRLPSLVATIAGLVEPDKDEGVAAPKAALNLSHGSEAASTLRQTTSPVQGARLPSSKRCGDVALGEAEFFRQAPG